MTTTTFSNVPERPQKTDAMQRNYMVVTLTIAESAALSGAFDFRPFSGGMVLIPSAWTAANIGFKVCDTMDGTYAHLEHHDSGEPVQINNIPTDTSIYKELPPEIFGAGFVKLWSKNSTDATETDTNQAAARTLKVILKA